MEVVLGRGGSKKVVNTTQEKKMRFKGGIWWDNPQTDSLCGAIKGVSVQHKLIA